VDPTATPSKALDLVAARRLTEDLMAPKPWLYWLDFGFSICLGWTALGLAVWLPLLSPLQGLSFVVACLAIYRSVIFTHELTHLKRSSFRVFRAFWNLSCGFPLMVPAYTYQGVHTHHHRRDKYGTREDGEYLPFAQSSPLMIVGYMGLVFVLPLGMLLRSVLLTPLAYLSPAIRRLVWAKFSSLTIDPSFERPPPRDAEQKRDWQHQELASMFFSYVFLGLIVFGLWPGRTLLIWYAVTVVMFILNSLRTLAAHAYRNPGADNYDLIEQFLDSVDVPGQRFFTTLWAPVGLRYHATHHLFAGMPYHNLGRARRRLEAAFGEGSDYMRVVRRSLPAALRQLWREARASRAAQ